MKILKYVFRIDYPVNYVLVDKLGEYLDHINNVTKKEPFSTAKNHIDIVSHTISSNGLIKNDKYILTLSLGTFNGEIEFEESTDFNDIVKCQLFSLVDKIIEKLKSSSNDYKRIGLRIWAIDTNENFKFDHILKYTLNLNRLFVQSISGYTPNLNDIALTFESINDDKESIRLSLGPYKATEWGKYFRSDHDIKEGLIFDVDIWQNKITIPNLKITEMIKQNIKLHSKILPAISKNLAEELKG